MKSKNNIKIIYMLAICVVLLIVLLIYNFIDNKISTYKKEKKILEKQEEALKYEEESLVEKSRVVGAYACELENTERMKILSDYNNAIQAMFYFDELKLKYESIDTYADIYGNYTFEQLSELYDIYYKAYDNMEDAYKIYEFMKESERFTQAELDEYRDDIEIAEFAKSLYKNIMSDSKYNYIVEELYIQANKTNCFNNRKQTVYENILLDFNNSK